MQSVIPLFTLERTLKEQKVILQTFDKVPGEYKAEIARDFREDIAKFIKEGTVSLKIKKIVDSLVTK